MRGDPGDSARPDPLCSGRRRFSRLARILRHGFETPHPHPDPQKCNSPPGVRGPGGLSEPVRAGWREKKRAWVPRSGSRWSPPVTGGTWVLRSGRILLGTAQGSQGEIPAVWEREAGTGGRGRGIGQVDLFDNVPRYGGRGGAKPTLCCCRRCHLPYPVHWNAERCRRLAGFGGCELQGRERLWVPE